MELQTIVDFTNLNLKSGSSFNVRVSYLGFKTEEFSFTAPTNDVNKDIVLYEQDQSIG